MKISGSFDKFSSAVSKVTSSPIAFICVVDTAIAIVTFLMLFVIQQAQSKDTLALQLKLNELIAATKGASNRVLNIEDMTEEELKVLKKFYQKLSNLSEQEGHSGIAHSVDEAKINEAFKEEIRNEDQDLI